MSEEWLVGESQPGHEATSCSYLTHMFRDCFSELVFFLIWPLQKVTEQAKLSCKRENFSLM